MIVIKSMGTNNHQQISILKLKGSQQRRLQKLRSVFKYQSKQKKHTKRNKSLNQSNDEMWKYVIYLDMYQFQQKIQMAQMKLNPSFSTIAALLNSMTGSAMLTLPVLFLSSGIITGILVLAISGFISYKTCRIYVIHLSQKDKDVEDSLERIINPEWKRFFKIITGFYLILLNIIYIQLINDQTYGIILFIMNTTGNQGSIAQKGIKQLVFNKFSIQYLCLIWFVPLLAVTFIKNLNFLVKLTASGVVSVFIYMIFLTYEFISNIGSVNWGDIKWLGYDIGDLAGTAALAFTIHTVVASIIKNNQVQANNERDLRISYILGFVAYTFIGMCGSLSIIYNKNCKVTIVDCFINDWQVLIVEVAYLLGLCTLYPCFLQVGRTRLLLTFYPQVTQKHFRIFNVVFVSVSTLFVFLSPFLSVSTVMGLVGSVVCFIFIYLIPIKLHLTCFYKDTSFKNLFMVKKDESLLESVIDDQTTLVQREQECFHGMEQCSNWSKGIRVYLYLLVMIIGVVIGIYGIYQFFDKILH